MVIRIKNLAEQKMKSEKNTSYKQF